MTKKNILMVAYGGGHAKMLVPIIKVLQSDHHYNVIVMALTTANKVMQSNSIAYVAYNDFLDLSTLDAKSVGEELMGVNSDSPDVPYSESVAYHGINYLDLVQQHGLENAKNIYKISGRQSFYPIHFVTKLLSELDVDLLVATNSPRTERAAIDAAGMLGIDSVCLVDLFALQEVQWIGKQRYASKLCVLNSAVKNMFLNVGRLEEEVVVTGNPAFDSINSRASIVDGKRLKESNGWDDGYINILYASQPEPEKHPFDERYGDIDLPRRIENELRHFIEKHDKHRLIIRYHPSENEKFKEQKNVSLSNNTDSLHSLLHAIDIVVVTASTVGLEGYIAGKNVVTVDNSIFTADAPFSVMGISQGVDNYQELEAKLLEISEKFVMTDSKSTTLNATEKVVAVIKSFFD